MSSDPDSTSPQRLPDPVAAPPSAIRVLHVGGSRAESQALATLFDGSTSRFEVIHCQRLSAGLELPEAKELDVILLDVESQGAEAVARVNDARQQAGQLPIVVLSDADDEELSLQLLHGGARGFVAKSDLSTRHLVVSVAAALESNRIIRQLNVARERERYLITHDHLTSLSNRVLFDERLFQAVGVARGSGEKLAVMVMDLDHFGDINETLGHAVGDGLLRSVAGHLVDVLGEHGTAARFGADEFALLLTGLANEFEAAGVAGEILAALCKPIPLRSRSIIVTGSIGIAAFPRDGSEPEQLIQRAQSAMNHAKKRGGNRYEFYTSDMNTSAIKRATLEDRLRSAVAEDGLVLHYQPQFDLRRNRMVGAEALVRWQHPEFGLLGPDTFLAVAEETGLIIPLGKWVLRTACRQNAEWQEQGHAGFRVSVNVSPAQFQERDFTSVLCDVLDETGLRPECLEIEITENSLVQDAEGTVNALHALKELGVHLAIDDFGTGYSALSYLKHLPIDVLKIDQAFIRTLTTDPSDATIVESVVRMARGLNLTTVAEGVETREQLLLLGSYGCTRMQGFLFGKAVPADELLELLRKPGCAWEERRDD